MNERCERSERFESYERFEKEKRCQHGNGSEADLLFWQAERLRAHSKNRQHFLVGLNLPIDVITFRLFGKSLPLVQFPQVLVNGNQHVLDELNISKILLDQFCSYSDTTLNVIFPSADCGFPFGIN